MRRKNSLPFVGDKTTWSSMLVKLSVGQLVMSAQLTKSGLSCSTKFVEGSIHESIRQVFTGPMFIDGLGIAWKAQIPWSSATANSLAPSAEEATEFHVSFGELFVVHVAPEFAEVQIGSPWSAATNLLPSADDAT